MLLLLICPVPIGTSLLQDHVLPVHIELSDLHLQNAVDDVVYLTATSVQFFQYITPGRPLCIRDIYVFAHGSLFSDNVVDRRHQWHADAEKNT